MYKTLQEVYDKASAHLRKQGRMATHPVGVGCLYRAPNGDMCAIGACIPDNVYVPEMDRATSHDTDIESIIDHFPEVKKLFADIDTDALVQLQVVHDSGHTLPGGKEFVRETLERRLQQYCKAYNLVYTPPSTPSVEGAAA